MRKTPFKYSKPTVNETVNTVETIEEETENLLDISEILAERPKVIEDIERKLNEEKEKIKEEKQTAATIQISEEEKEEAETEPEFEEEIKTVEKTAKMFDPEGFAETIVEVANIGRSWIYPSIYEKIVFNQFEQKDLFDIQRKVNKAQKEDKEPELSNYEISLLKKNEELVKAKMKIDFSGTEKKLLAKKLSRHIAEIDFIKRLEKYDWVLVLLAIEGMRFAELKKIKSM